MPPIAWSLGCIGEIPPLKRRNHGNWRPAPEGNTSFTCWVWFQYVQKLAKWLLLKLGTSPRKHIAEMKDFMFGLCLELHLTPVRISVFCHCRCTLWTPPQQWPIVRSSRWFSEMPRAQQRPSRPRYGPWQSVAKPTRNKSAFWAKLSDVALNEATQIINQPQLALIIGLRWLTAYHIVFPNELLEAQHLTVLIRHSTWMITIDPKYLKSLAEGTIDGDLQVAARQKKSHQVLQTWRDWREQIKATGNNL